MLQGEKKELKMSKREEKDLYIAGWIFLFLLLLIHVGIRKFSFSLPFHGLPCLLREWTGIYCPGCGGTRACKAFLEGHFLQSFLYHPVVPYAGFLYGWFMFSHTVEFLTKGRFPIGMKFSDRYLHIALILILIQWIVKNALKFIWGITWL